MQSDLCRKKYARMYIWLRRYLWQGICMQKNCNYVCRYVNYCRIICSVRIPCKTDCLLGSLDLAAVTRVPNVWQGRRPIVRIIPVGAEMVRFETNFSSLVHCENATRIIFRLHVVTGTWMKIKFYIKKYTQIWHGKIILWKFTASRRAPISGEAAPNIVGIIGTQIRNRDATFATIVLQTFPVRLT